MVPSGTRMSSSVERVTIVESRWPKVVMASRRARTSRSRVWGSSTDAQAWTRPAGVTKSTFEAGRRAGVGELGGAAAELDEDGGLEELAEVGAAAAGARGDQARVDGVDLARVDLARALRVGVDRDREEHERVLDVLQPGVE